MAKLSLDAGRTFVKLLLIGDSGTGKTAALMSLLKAGYKLYVIDMDDGLTYLKQLIRAEPNPEELLDLIEVQTFVDEMATGDGGPYWVTHNSYVRAVKALETWDDGTVLSELGPECVVVIDTFNFLSIACVRWIKGMNSAMKDNRRIIGAAQDSLVTVVENLKGEHFKTNVIIMSHVDYRSPSEGVIRGTPQSAGEKLGQRLPTYFDTMLLSERRGIERNVEYRITVRPTDVVDVKCPVLDDEVAYPSSEALATIFRKLKGL